jgi:hypothetical protein
MISSLPSFLRSPSTARTALRIVIGFLLLILGVILAFPGIPGPGIPIALLGLWILSDHFTWAKSALAWARKKTARLRRNRTHREVVNQVPEQK